MANFYGTARSNYFRVKDEAAFRQWASDRDLGVMEKDGLFAITPEGTDDGCFPTLRYDEENDEDIEVVISLEVSEHLAEGEIAVLMQAGAEKLRYISGYAVAVNDKGERVQLVLSDIYELAKKAFGKSPTEATY